MSSADRMKWLIEQTGLNKSQFAKLLGKGYKDVHAWTQGREPDTRSCILIHQKTGASIDWLLLGTGPSPAVRRIDPATLGGAEIIEARASVTLGALTANATGAVSEPTVHRDNVPTALADFLARRKGVTEAERAHLMGLAANTGKVDYEAALVEYRGRAKGKLREAEATKVELGENVGRLSPAKRRKS